MAEVVDAKLLKQVRLTQDILGEFVKRPTLTEKHLVRPPFRYLHDIFMTVLDSTGFFKGLFTPEEMNGAGIVNKESKNQFIEKVIAVIEITSGESLDVKASRVLAGVDVDRTNILLQTLGKCLQKRQSSNEAVKSVTGVDPGQLKGRRGSTSNDSNKTKPAPAGKTSTAGQDLAKGQGKKTGPVSQGQSIRSTPENAKGGKSRTVSDKEPKTSTSGKIAAGPYAKAAPKTVPADYKSQTKTKPGSRDRSQEPAPGGSKPTSKGQTQPAAAPGRNRNRDRDPSPAVAVDDSKKISRSRRGSMGSPSNTNIGQSEKVVEKVEIERPMTVTLRNEEPQEAESPPPIMGEMDFVLNQYGYDVQISDDDFFDEKDTGQINNGLSLPGDPTEVVEMDQVIRQKSLEEESDKEIAEAETLAHADEDYPPLANAYESKSSAGFASGEDNDDDVGDLNNSISPLSPYPGPARNETRTLGNILDDETEEVPRKPLPVIKAPGDRPASRSNARQHTATVQSTREQTTTAEQENVPLSNADENRPMMNVSISERKATAAARPPTSSIKNRQPHSARPTSARPGAPRPRSALVVQVDENAYRPPTGKVLNVLMDTEEPDDDGDNYVVQELPPSTKMLEDLDETQEFGIGLGEVDGEVPEGQRGLLLNQILETKKELEGGKPSGPDDTSGDPDRFKYLRDSTRAEVEKLQNLIQATAKSAHPLGKLMDFIQEDVDSIHQELLKWQDESQKLDSALELELAQTETSLDPLRQELAQIEEAIQDQEDAIDATRMEIQQQETRINKILSGFESTKPHGEFNKTIQLPPLVKIFGMEVALNDSDRTLVFGDGSRLEVMEPFSPKQGPVSTTRSRPKSQYTKPQWNSGDLSDATSAENFELTKPQTQSESDMRARMKSLASTMAKDISRDDDEFAESFSPAEVPAPPPTRQRRGSMTPSPSNSSANLTPSPTQSSNQFY